MHSRIKLAEFFAVVVAVFLSRTGYAQNSPFVGQNVNMVSGVTLADGDPFLTKQNEPSIAVSSMNPMHLLAGSNDYRLIPQAQLLDAPSEGQGADSWVGLYKSIDGGRTWRSTVVSGCPLNIAQCNSPLNAAIKGLQYASDPTVRSGPYGTFFYSFIAGVRGTGANSVIAVQRYSDLNNNVKFSDDPFQASALNIIDGGTTGQFKDKPWNAADIPGRPWNAGATCTLPTSAQPVPAFNVYVSYSNFVGQDPSNPHPQIMVATSNNCGLTFGKPKKISQSVATSQGTVITIDPATGAVYVIWRQIFTASNNSPDAIYFAKSTDGGASWSSPALIANITPFEQETTSTSFRAEAFPTAAVSVSNGISRVHVAWSQRGVGPGGAARIVMVTSSNGGTTWSAPVPVDNNFQNQPVPYAPGPNAVGSPSWAAFNTYNTAGYGHQLQPSLTFAAGKLTLIWLDQRLDHTIGVIDCSQAPATHNITQCTEMRTQRKSNTGAADDPSKVFTEDVDDGTPGLLFRHTLDVFGGQAVPADQPVFATTRVSKYLFGSSTLNTSPQDPVRTPKVIRQLRFNVPNIPIFASGTKPFLGDYTDVAAQTMVPTGNPSQPYVWNTSASNKTTVHTAFTTNQDVVPPKNGNWAAYTPVKVLAADGVTLVSNGTCAPGQEGTQNQNIYTASIFDGIEAYAVTNSKYLNNVTPRPFNVVVQNGTSQTASVSLTVTQPANGAAGFKVTGNTVSVTSVFMSIPPASSAARSVWVRSSNPGATVTVNVATVNPDGSNPIPLTSVVLNPDPPATTVTAIPPPPAGDVTNNNQSDVSARTNDLSNNDLSNNDLSNNDLSNNDLSNNDLSNNDLSNNDLSNAAVTANDLSNNDLSNNDLSNNDLSNNDLSNNDLSNNDLSNNDLSNAGLTDSTFTLFNNGTTDQTLDIKSLMRGGSIPAGYKVQLIIHKTYTSQTAASCSFAKVQQNIPVLNVPNPAITTTTDLSAQGIIDSWVTDPSSSNATVPLMPQEIARVSFRLVKTGGPTRSDNQSASSEFGANGVKVVGITQSNTIVPIPLVIDTLQLPDATAGQSYTFQLQASGGLAPISWSLFGGALPPGFNSLTGGGLISGVGTQPGIYTFTVLVGDSSGLKQQTDKQTLTLIVHGVQTVIAPAGPLSYGTPLTLNANSSAGLPVTYSSTSPSSCSVSGNIATAISGTGSCTVSASQAGNQIYLPLSTSLTFTLAKAPLAVTASSATVAYGYPVPAITPTYNGFVPGDSSSSLGTQAVCSTTYTSGSDAGTVQTTSCNGAASTKYDFTYTGGTVNVIQAPVAVTASSASVSYGDPVPSILASFGAFRNGQTSTVLTTQPVCTTTYTQVSNAGSYPTTCSGGQALNYSFTYVPGAVTVNQISVTVTASSATVTFGDPVPAITASFSAFKNGQTSAVLTTQPVCATTYTPASAAGSLQTTSCSGASATNYTFTYAGGTVMVKKATPVLLWSNPAPIFYGTPLSGAQLNTVANVPGTFVYLPAAGSILGTGSGQLLSVTFTPVDTVDYNNAAAGVTITVNKATPVFSNLSNVSITAGTASMVLGGTLSYTPAGGSPVFPSGSVSITLNGVTQAASIAANGTFSSSFATGALPPGTYPIAYKFTSGDSNFNPATDGAGSLKVGGFVSTGSMTGERSFHTATLLNDGTVLVAGGLNKSGQSLATAEIYNPATGQFGSTVNNMPNKAVGHTATLLPNGKVLIVGGGNSSSQIFDPATKLFSSAGGSGQRSYHTAVLLLNGKVLIAGGSDNSGKTLNSALLYDPVAGTFTGTGNLTTSRDFHTATLLPNGKVLIAGGRTSSGAGYAYLSSAELYDPATGVFSAVTTPMSSARFGHAASLVNGKVLVTGGSNGSAAIASSDLYDPTAGTFASTGPLTTARQYLTATSLGTSVLLAGGSNATGALISAEIYQAGASALAGTMTAARAAHTATLLNDGRVLVVGGQGSTGVSVATAELFQ